MRTIVIIIALFSTLAAQAQEKKFDFEPVKPRFILEKIAKTNPGTWSLTKNTNKRHYGLTDKELYENFGNDRVGKIGKPTAFSADDKAGLNYVAIHALILRNKKLAQQLTSTQNELEMLQKEFQHVQNAHTEVQKALEEIEQVKEMKIMVKEMEMRITDLEEQLEEMKSE